MITAPKFKGMRVGVFGLARTGLAAVRALEASGAIVRAWDDNADRREAAGAAACDLYALDFNELDALMLAPGVPLTHPEPHALVKKARGAGVAIISDFDVFQAGRGHIPQHRVVAITGTNGKSTTTALIGHMVRECGLPAAIGGNIGTGVLSLDPLPTGGVYVFELSSFQLDLTRVFHADVAVLLNITPDHLDRHGDMAGYVAAKKRLFDMQTPDAFSVIGVDDHYCEQLAGDIPAQVTPVSVKRDVAGGVYVRDGFLFDAMEGAAVRVGSLQSAQALQGTHNWQNAAAAYAAGKCLGFSSDAILAAFDSFPGLAHRQELVATIGGVRFVNDSKATNVDAAERALATFTDIYWIAGGKPKGKSFAALLPYLGNVKKAYLIGEATDYIAADIEGEIPFVKCASLSEAIGAARTDAPSGATVLLSPACAAFDQFRDFEARGDAFRKLVTDMEGAAA